MRGTAVCDHAPSGLSTNSIAANTGNQCRSHGDVSARIGIPGENSLELITEGELDAFDIIQLVLAFNGYARVNHNWTNRRSPLHG